MSDTLSMTEFEIKPLTPEEELTLHLQNRKKMGRPGYNWSEEIVEEICELLAIGTAIGDICAMKGMPSYWLFNKRERTDPEFATMVSLAREAAAEYHLSQVIGIADDSSHDTMTVTYGRGENAVSKDVCDTEWVQRSKLRVDARFTKAKMIAPHKYNVAAVQSEHHHTHKMSGRVKIRKIEVEYIEPVPLGITHVENIIDEEEEQ